MTGERGMLAFFIFFSHFGRQQQQQQQTLQNIRVPWGDSQELSGFRKRERREYRPGYPEYIVFVIFLIAGIFLGLTLHCFGNGVHVRQAIIVLLFESLQHVR